MLGWMRLAFCCCSGICQRNFHSQIRKDSCGGIIVQFFFNTFSFIYISIIHNFDLNKLNQMLSNAVRWNELIVFLLHTLNGSAMFRNVNTKRKQKRWNTIFKLKLKIKIELCENQKRDNNLDVLAMCESTRQKTTTKKKNKIRGITII